jgi:PAS domain S-box-containing protein
VFRHDNIAARVAAAYLLAGLTWVLVTDLLLYGYVLSPVTGARLETAKGWAFILFSASCVYGIAHWQFMRLRRAQETTRAIVESMADAVFVIGPHERVMYANPAALEMLDTDLQTLRDLSAEAFLRRYHPSYHDDGHVIVPEEYAFRRVFKGEGVPPHRLLLKQRDRILVLNVTSAPVRVEGGRVERSVTVARDVTELEKLDQLRNDFFAAAGHALKTPVATVKAYAHLLSANDEERVRRAAVAIDRQTQRMELLVDNFLALARLRDGSLRLHPHELALAPLIEEVTTDMRSSCPDNTLVEEIASSPKVFADAERLAQVLCNLIELARRDAVRKSEIAVMLSERNGSARFGVRFEPLSVENAPEEVLERRHRPQPPEQPESGLERHVSEALVQAHAGKLFSEHTKGGQTKVWVEIPTIAEAARG